MLREHEGAGSFLNRPAAAQTPPTGERLASSHPDNLSTAHRCRRIPDRRGERYREEVDFRVSLTIDA
jgi:hypothetical protein